MQGAPARRYHRIDGWRGYQVPATAIAGSSDTGTWSDSPAPTPAVLAELRKFRREVLKPLGIKSRSRIGSSSNVFMAKRWLVVDTRDFPRAAQAAVDYLKAHDSELRYVHDADLDALGYKPSRTLAALDLARIRREVAIETEYAEGEFEVLLHHPDVERSAGVAQ